VLNGRKIRLIAQENAAMGIMDTHDTGRVPIVDLSWNLQDSPMDAGAGLHSHPSQQLLASLSVGGEVCIGSVYAESNSALVYEPISATTFPELNPARGIAWNEEASAPLLAVHGAGPEIYLMSVQPAIRTAALTTDLDSVESVRFGDNGKSLYIAGLDKILIVSIRSIEDTFTAQTIPLLPGAQRVWLMPHAQGVFAVAAVENDQLLIHPLFGNTSEVIISISLPGPAEHLFVTFDQLTNILCVGAGDSNRLVCINLVNFTNPILSAGVWPNDNGAVSVFSTSQLHSVFSKPNSSSDVDMFLYAYHNDSVKMHRVSVLWETTKSADEPEHLPSPPQEILRPLRSASTSASPSPLPSGMINATAFNKSREGQNIVKDVVEAINKQLGEQNKQARRERREAEVAEQRRQQELVTATVQGIQQTVVGTLHSVVQQEAGRVLDARLSTAIDQCLGRLDQQVGQKCEVAIGKSFGKTEKFAGLVAAQLTQTLAGSVDHCVKEAVETRLLPGLQSIMTDLVGQLSANIAQAIVDSTIEQYKLMISEMSELRQTVIELQHRAFKLPSAQELAQTVSQEIRQSLSPVAGQSPVTRVDPLSELEATIRTGHGAVALIKVLEMGDIKMLNWILPRLDVNTILDAPELSPAVTLSLAQQLGYELRTLTEVKLTWLAELFTVFDPRLVADKQLAVTLPAVLDELFANLRVMFAEIQPSSPCQKQIKTVMRLVRMAMDA
jgi:hypothetical protein